MVCAIVWHSIVLGVYSRRHLGLPSFLLIYALLAMVDAEQLSEPLAGRTRRPDSAVADRLRRALARARTQHVVSETSAPRLVPALQHRLQRRSNSAGVQAWAIGAREPKRSPLEYMQLCRRHLAKLDTLGWTRSYHQRLFHDDFLKACTRSFWKLEPPGQFARDHMKVLRVNSWDHIAQEILISTPRRFGKTISVSMFCAAMMLSCPGVEISIYSTCKRISQKILRNVQKFAMLIADMDYGSLNFSVKRENMEEINLQGPLGSTDVRIINSYPSKVGFVSAMCCRVCRGLLLRLRHQAELAVRERQRRGVGHHLPDPGLLMIRRLLMSRLMSR